MPAPYVIAQVAIAEDPRVRLTTNIVECDPDQLELGQQVEVVFEQVEDVWLPLFRPTADAERAPLPADEIAPERFGEYVRPMLTAEKFEDKVALTGIGMSPIGRRLMATAAVADRASVRGGDRRCRADVRRHRRPVDLSRRRQPRRVRRGRGHRAGGGAGYPADLAQRRDRDVRPGRIGDRRDARGRRRPGPSRAVLPDAVGSHLQRADEAGQDHPVDGPHRRLAVCRSAPRRPRTPWR